MTRSYTWSLGKPTVSNRLDGDVLSISSSCPFTVGLGCSGHVRLVVPKDLEVRMHSSDGSVTLRDLDGPVDVSTSDGSIYASNLTGRLACEPATADRRHRPALRPRSTLSTSDGSVRLAFAVAPVRRHRAHQRRVDRGRRAGRPDGLRT